MTELCNKVTLTQCSLKSSHISLICIFLRSVCFLIILKDDPIWWPFGTCFLVQLILCTESVVLLVSLFEIKMVIYPRVWLSGQWGVLSTMKSQVQILSRDEALGDFYPSVLALVDGVIWYMVLVVGGSLQVFRRFNRGECKLSRTPRL